MILSATALPLPRANLPSPTEYEHVIALSNTWCNVTKSQLTENLAKQFSGCIGFGGVFLPKYADPKYGVTGRLINMTPKFFNTIPQNQHEKLFYWSNVDGKWFENNC